MNKEELITKHTNFALSIARKLGTGFKGSIISKEDLEAEALLSLCEAAKSFNKEKGIKFTSYAYLFIRGSVIDAINKDQNKKTTPQPEFTEFELHGINSKNNHFHQSLGQEINQNLEISYLDQKTPEESAIRNLEYQQIISLLNSLPKEEQKIITDHFFNGLSISEIARKANKSRGDYSRKYNSALKFIKSKVIREEGDYLK